MEVRNGEDYLAMYPRLAARWINQCVVCQRKGHKPELPDVLWPGGSGAANLRKYFRALAVDAAGVCDQSRDGLSTT